MFGSRFSYYVPNGIITYAIAPDVTTIYEGNYLTYTVTTTGLADGTVLYWAHSGTVSSFDFGDGVSSGSITINSNTGTLNRLVSFDTSTETDETVTLNLYTGSVGGTLVATAAPVTVREGVSVSYYSIINEGMTYYPQISYRTNSTAFYWEIVHITTVAGDFSATSGTVTVAGTTAPYTALMTLTTTMGTEIEGEKTFRLRVRFTNSSGTVVYLSPIWTLKDMAVSIVNPPTTVNENTYFTMTSRLLNLASSMTAPVIGWKVKHGTTVDADFGSVGGNITTSWNGSYGAWEGTLGTATAYDLSMEPDETFQLEIRYGGTLGNVIATTDSITIPSWSMAITNQPTTINENSAGTFTARTTNLGNYSTIGTLYWTVLHGTTAAGDFTGASGTFTPTYSAGVWSGNFAVYTAFNATIESAETFQVEVRLGSTAGTVIATSNIVTIPAWSMAITNQPTTINENSGGTFTINTSNLGNIGTITAFYWTILHGTTAAGDFQAVSGSFTPTYSASVWSGNFAVYTQYNATPESSETFQVQVRVGSVGGTVVATSNTVTIPAWSLSITNQPTTILENSGGTFTINTSNLGNIGTIGTLYWTVLHGTTVAADFQGASGTFTPTYSAGVWSGNFAVYTAFNAIAESEETFQVQVRLGSTSGTVVATSSVVTIPAWSMEITSQPTTINENSGGTFSIRTSNLGNIGTITAFYWTILHGTSSSTDFQGVSGSFTPSYSAAAGAWTGSFAVYPSTDVFFDMNETFQVEVRAGSVGGVIKATSNTVTINNVGPTHITVSAAFTVGQSSNAALYTTDGTSWTAVTMPASTFWVDTAFNPGNVTRGVAVAWSSTNFAYTSNKGTTWTAATAPSNTSWLGCAAVTSTTWIAVNDSNSIGHAYSTNNGVSWTQGTLVTTATGCAGNGSGIAVVVNNTLTLNYTTNGTSFSTVTLGANNSNFTQFTRIEYVSGYWIVFSGSQGRYIYVSTNGASWSNPIDVTGGIPYNMRAINWNGSMWIIACDMTATYFTSPDLITWTQRSFPNSRRYSGITWIASKWVAIVDGESGVNIKSTSTDGINWTESGLSAAQRWMDLTSVR